MSWLSWREQGAPSAADAPTVQGIRTELSELTGFTASQLLKAAQAWRQRSRSSSRADAVETGCALAGEALRRTLGISLYDEQYQAALALLSGHVAEMQTGEGKTFACFPAAVVRGLEGRGVHVVTPNPYLAARDHRQLAPAFAAIGLTCGLLPEQAPSEAKRAAYDCDVTYGTAYEFGFDYLRDQLRLRNSRQDQLGRRLLRHLSGADDRCRRPVQRGLACAIVDEVDNVLLDDAISPLVLTADSEALAADALAHEAARRVLGHLVPSTHYEIDVAGNSLWLTEVGIERVHAAEVDVPFERLQRTWTEYVEQALRAELLMLRDRHYIVDGQVVRIVDPSTGRIFQDRSWRDGLHQAVEAKEGVPITAERVSLLQITRQRFFHLYSSLCGMTGTATGCEAEFQRIYGLTISPIPLRCPSQRVLWPWRVFRDSAAKNSAIAASVRELRGTGRPCLIGTRTIADSEILAAHLSAAHIPFQLLNGRQDAQEAQIIAHAGELGTVTIATNLAGRGTDIRLQPDVAQRGGLHVIVAECQESARIDRQLIGRSARQGDPGSAQVFLSADDAVIRRQGAWLARYILRHIDADGELRQDITPQLRRLQRGAEAADYAARCALMRRDQSHSCFYHS